MRILASGDHHFDEHRRFDECRRVHEWMVTTARAERVHLFLSGGDVYERASTPLEREAVADWLVAMAEICPVLITKGNHDRRRDCAILGRLKSHYPIIVEEAAAIHWLGPGHDKACIGAVAWPDRGSVLAALGGGGSSEQADQATHGALCDVLRGLGEELAQHDGPRILLGHFMTEGAETSTGQPLLGQPIRVGLADLALARADLILMAHIHKAQQWDMASCLGLHEPITPALYMGSPFRTDFGQLEKKSVVLAEFRGPLLSALTEIETPARPMLHLEDEWGWSEYGQKDEWLVGLHYYDGPESVRGAEIRFRYRVPSDKQEAAAAAASRIVDELTAEGAVYVKPEPVVIATKRARAPEVARATTIADKLEAYWPSVGFVPGDRKANLLDKAGQIESEAQHAT